MIHEDAGEVISADVSVRCQCGVEVLFQETRVSADYREECWNCGRGISVQITQPIVQFYDRDRGLAL